MQNRWHTLPLIAALIAAAACAGDRPAPTAPASALAPAASRVGTTTTTFVLTQLDGASPPALLCAADGTTLTGGTLALSSKGTYLATFSLQSAGSTAVTTYQDKGTYSVSDGTIQFRSPGVGTFTGTLSTTSGVTTLTATYPYCGITHTLVFQQQ